MSDEALRNVYARIMRARDTSGRASTVSVEQMRALLERRGTEQERVRTLDAIMRDQDTRADFEILRAAYEAAPARMVSMHAPFAIAAALVVMIGGAIWVRSRTALPDTLRGSTAALSTIGPGPTAVAGTPIRFTWHPVPAAKGYSVQMVDQNGGVAFSATTADTSAVMPANVKLAPDTEYRWWVEAERSPGGPVKSAVQPLLITNR